MATQAELDTALDNLATAVKDAAERVRSDLAALTAKINALPNASDLSAEVNKVKASIDALAAIDPAAPTPVPEPAPQTFTPAPSP